MKYYRDLWALSPPLVNLSGEASLNQVDIERIASQKSAFKVPQAPLVNQVQAALQAGERSPVLDLTVMVIVIIVLLSVCMLAVACITCHQKGREAKMAAARQQAEGLATTVAIDRRTGSGHLGLTVEEAGDASQVGAIVTRVHPHDLAWTAGIANGDLLIRVNGLAIDDPAQAIAAIEESTYNSAIVELLIVPAASVSVLANTS